MPTTPDGRHCQAARHASVCAWCRAELCPGDPALPVSHGICPACAVAVTGQPADAESTGSG